jgi:hypothetical protein
VIFDNQKNLSRKELVNMLTHQNLLDFLPKIFKSDSEFKLTEPGYLWNVIKSKPAKKFKDSITFLLECVAQPKESFLKGQESEIYLFLKQNANEVCQEAFNDYFGEE